MTTSPAAPASGPDAPALVRTREIDLDDAGLLARLPVGDAVAWVRGGEGLVGWGEAARFEASGPERFSRVARWWNEWVRAARIDDGVGVAGSGAVAFTSFAFASDPGSSVLVVPRVLLGNRGGRAWVTVVGDDDPAGALDPVDPPRAPGVVRYCEGALPPAQWADRVQQAVERIRAGELDKVVLARDVEALLDAPLDPRHLLLSLAERHPGCWTFAVDGLIGSTPELLVRREGDEVTSRVLAGTVPRAAGSDAETDGRRAAALLASGKDRAEHAYAVRSVAAALAVHCTDLHVPERPEVLQLANVAHLATDVRGRLAADTPVLALAASLHPTAAVCGTPTERAADVIDELEGMDRGRYAGPVGWIDARGDGEMGIALRCARVLDGGRRLRLFAGCGIVEASDPAAELAESEAKLDAVRAVLDAVG